MAAPNCKAILLCENMEFINGKANIIGVIDAVGFPQYPAFVKDIWLYMYLISGNGKCNIKVRVVDGATDEEIATSPGTEHEFSNRFVPFHVKFPVLVTLPREGIYYFVALSNDEEIDRLRLDARVIP